MHIDTRSSPTLLSPEALRPAASRPMQLIWLLCALPALTLALPGIPLLRQRLAQVCGQPPCPLGELYPSELELALTYGDSLAQYASIAVLFYLAAYAMLFITAGTLIWRKSTNRAAVAAAFMLAAAATSTLAGIAAQSFPIFVPAAQLIHFVQVAGLLYTFCLIPDGRFEPGWLRIAALILTAALALAAFDLLDPAMARVVSIVIVLTAAGSLLFCYSRGVNTPQAEQPIWGLSALLLLLAAQAMGRPLSILPDLALPPAVFPIFGLGPTPVSGLVLLSGGLACLIVLFLRQDLFRIEVAINRTIVYALLTLFVIGGYGLIVGYFSYQFQASDNLWFSLIATGVVAIAFQPVRQWTQQAVNTLLYGRRDDPYQLITDLGRQLEATLTPDATLPAITRLVQESLRLPYVAIALEHDGGYEVASASGSRKGELIPIPLLYQGRVEGQLLVTPRQGETELSRADRVLLHDLAKQAGAAVRVVRLTAELQQLAADLQQSRERIVLAREEERRRIRRDLHDDLAPALIGLSLRAGNIGDLVETDPREAAALASNLDSALRGAVGNIRRLVYDLRPPALDDLGLLAAIRDRALEYSSGDGLQVRVDAPETLPPLPAAVEVAAYRIVQEGMLNVVKHAQAENCLVRIAVDGSLQIWIVDDGIGVPERQAAGVGLRSIRERAAELRGTCEIHPHSLHGTEILVCLPLSDEGKP